MSFTVYNTLTRKKERFESQEAGLVRMYNCGPTVYSRPHVGNYRTFLFADTLRRWLEYRGYEVRQVMNITDVGHVQAEQDEGEDKLEVQARRERTDPWQISRRITDQFLEDLRALGFRPALCYPRATEHIPEMLALIEQLLASGHAYQVDGNVYFSVASFPEYGKLSGNKVEDLVAGARVEVLEHKRHPADFALWKSDARHVMKWSSRFGPDGFPGWHIECSAMAMKHLGKRLDIHSGGEDNIFPHHECEIAQSEGINGAPFATYWMHAKFLQVDGGKMSKSLGNVYTLDDVRARGFEPRVLRFALIRGHYRAPLNFTWAAMADARSALLNLDDLVRRLRAAAEEPRSVGAELVAGAREAFERAMDDDLNVPEALPSLFGLRSAVLEGRLAGEGARAALAFLERVDLALGVLRLEPETLDARVQALVDARQAARARRDFAEADRLRRELEALGIALEDTPKGVNWRRR
jgi:cysteinyl-tRNA synthetase